MTNDLTKIYRRDLDKLKEEIQAFGEEDNLWKTAGSVINPAGNLCLHLTGNLNTFIARNLGGYPYVRNRDAEFNLRNVPRDELVRQVEDVKIKISDTLAKVTPMQLKANHPEDVFGYKMTNSFFLIHLASHLSYHLGQINYLRRILE